jgi:hypothetical protein
MLVDAAKTCYHAGGLAKSFEEALGKGLLTNLPPEQKQKMLVDAEKTCYHAGGLAKSFEAQEETCLQSRSRRCSSMPRKHATTLADKPRVLRRRRRR